MTWFCPTVLDDLIWIKGVKMCSFFSCFTELLDCYFKKNLHPNSRALFIIKGPWINPITSCLKCSSCLSLAVYLLLKDFVGTYFHLFVLHISVSSFKAISEFAVVSAATILPVSLTSRHVFVWYIPTIALWHARGHVFATLFDHYLQWFGGKARRPAIDAFR